MAGRWALVYCAQLVPGTALDQQLALWLPLPLIVVANLAEAGRRSERSRSVLRALVSLSIGLLALNALLSGLTALPSSLVYGLILTVTGLLVATLVTPPWRWLLHPLGLDRNNCVQALAAAFGLVLLGDQLSAQLGANALASEATAVAPLTALSLLLQELPFLLAAVLGVGLFTRRSAVAVAARLGWERPTWSQIALALAAAIAFFGVGSGADWLSQALTPQLARQVSAANGNLFGGLMSPGGVAVIALAAGVCEEALFRGALQPRFGLALSALLFALLHTQYGLSIDTLAVFVLAIGLGLLRRFANTTTSTITHVTYNGLVGLGAGIPVPVLLLLLALLLLVISVRHLVSGGGRRQEAS